MSAMWRKYETGGINPTSPRTATPTASKRMSKISENNPIHVVKGQNRGTEPMSRRCLDCRRMPSQSPLTLKSKNIGTQSSPSYHTTQCVALRFTYTCGSRNHWRIYFPQASIQLLAPAASSLNQGMQRTLRVLYIPYSVIVLNSTLPLSCRPQPFPSAFR